MDNELHENIILTEEEQENLQQCGAVGFSPDEVAIVFGWGAWLVHRQFDEKKGNIYETYMKGRLQAELNIRMTVVKSAQNGSTPAQQQLQEYYRIADQYIGD